MDTRLRVLLGALALAVLFGLLYLASRYNYNLFHSLAELFSIAVAFAIFAIAWNSRHFASSESLLFLGIALALVAITDLFHLLAYKGMGVFEGTDSDLPTQLWLIGRYQFTLAFLLLPLLIERHRSLFPLALGSFSAVTAGLYGALFIAGVFPRALIEGEGLTIFKRASEYAVCGLLLAAGVLLYRRRAKLAPRVLRLIGGAIILTIVSELAFTLYVDPYGFFNLIGHYLKILAFYLLYKAMVETTLVNPYSVLFRELQASEQLLARSEREFRSTFEQAAVGMARIDGEGRVLLANERLGELSGYDAAELEALGIAAILHPDDREGEMDLIREVLLERRPSAVRETRLLRKNGAPMWGRLTVSPVVDAAGNPEHVLLVVEDITEAKRVEREREELLARLEGVAEVTEAAMQSLELDDLMRNTLGRMVGLMRADAAVILLRKGERLNAVASVGLEAEVVQRFSLSIGEGFAGHIAATGQPYYLADAQNAACILSSVIKDSGIRSMLGVPLRRGDALLGVLHVDWLAERPYDEAGLHFLELVADRISLAIFNADLYRRQREVAETLQQEMVAVPMTLPGIRFGHVYRSATEGANVGGDFYDIFPVGGSHVWAVIGDVSGHGIEAATAASLIREITRVLALEDLPPDVVAQRLNRAVVHRLGFRHFATMFLGRLDRESGALEYCSAGHPPAYLLRTSGEVVRFPVGNLPVGAFADAEYRGGRSTLRPGEKLVLYTDGVLEARTDSLFFGEDRLAEVLHGADVPETIPRLVLQAVEGFSSGRLVDDVAVLCISPQ